MEMFVESPWPAIILGVTLLALVAVAYANTARRGLLAIGGGVVAITLLLVGLEIVVVTEVEEVEQTLDQVAEALETNDLDRVMEHLAPDAAKIRFAASSLLPRVTVTDAKVGDDLKVTINRITNPHTARAEFTGRLSFDTQGTTNPYGNFVRRFAIKLQKSGDRWLLSEYEESGLRN